MNQSDEGQGAKVLLVQNPETHLKNVELVLYNADLHIANFSSAEDALENCQPNLLDVVILDISLPGKIGGIELGVLLKKRAGPRCFLPVIIVGQKYSAEDCERSFASGCDEYFSHSMSAQEQAMRMKALITRKRMHTELVGLNKSLELAQEKRSKLAALIVHDMRNPLAAMVGNVQLLQEWGKEKEESEKEILQDLEALGEKTLRLLSGLLDVEELEDGLLKATPSENKLVDFIKHFPRFYEVEMNARNVQLEIDIPESLTAFFDKELIGRVVENLLDNSVRYAPRAGQVIVKCRRQEKDLIIEVGNSGQAIPDSEVEHIFERYYGLGKRRQGARIHRGLGLYFCRLAAEAHHGSIAVVSSPTIPACFLLRLPDCVVETKRD